MTTRHTLRDFAANFWTANNETAALPRTQLQFLHANLLDPEVEDMMREATGCGAEELRREVDATP